MNDERANQFLSLIRRARRGRHKVYLGYGPGVGKTTLMLQEGHRLTAEGVDLVIGIVETHDRVGTAALVSGLAMIPRRSIQYHGITVDEMDIDAILASTAQVVLVDELAHTNVPGSRNEKRWQDVQELLAVGKHVISTVNIQHLESLYDTVEKQVGIRVRERIPDAVLAEADQVVNVDLAPEDLQKRLEQGLIYPRDRIPAAMGNYFQSANLGQLRELTLRELAAQIDFKRRETKTENAVDAPDQIMVCLSSRGPNSARLLRFASRLAGRLNRTWYAVYVQTPTEDPIAIDATTQRHISETLTLANQLGAMVFTFQGEDVPQTILRFAKEYRVGHIVIGKPVAIPLWKRLLGRTSIAEELIRQSTGQTVVVVDARNPEPEATNISVPSAQAPVPGPPSTLRIASVAHLPRQATETPLSSLLDLHRIVVWKKPVGRQDAIRQLVQVIAACHPGLPIEVALQRLDERERQGSTFLNQGLALPHAKLPGLSTPLVALGLTQAGISDMTDQPVGMVLLILSPLEDQTGHLRLLATGSRMHQDRDLKRTLANAPDSENALGAIAQWEEMHRNRLPQKVVQQEGRQSTGS